MKSNASGSSDETSPDLEPGTAESLSPALQELVDVSLALDLDQETAFRLLDEEIAELKKAAGDHPSSVEEISDVYFALFNLSRVLTGRHHLMDVGKVLKKVEDRLETYGTIAKLAVSFDDEDLFRRLRFDVVNFAFGIFKHPWRRFDAFKNGTEAELAAITSTALVNQRRRGNHVILTYSEVPEIQVSILSTSWSLHEGNAFLVRIPDWLFTFCKAEYKLQGFESLLVAQIKAVMALLRLSETPVFHFHSWESGFLADQSRFPWAGKRVFSPYLTVSRLLELMLREPNKDWTLSDRAADRAAAYESRLVGFCDQVVVESDRDKSFYSKLNGNSRVKKVSFIPRETFRFQVNLAPKDSYRLITGGRAVREKGFDLLIESLPALEVALDARLELRVICREKSRTTGLEKYPGYIQSMRELALRLGLEDRVSIDEKVSIAELESLIAESDCMIVPSRYDPFCLMPIHGWRVAKPVLVSSRTGIAERIDDPRFVFDPHDVNDLGKKLKGLVGQSLEFCLEQGASNGVSSIYLD